MEEELLASNDIPVSTLIAEPKKVKTSWENENVGDDETIENDEESLKKKKKKKLMIGGSLCLSFSIIICLVAYFYLDPLPASSSISIYNSIWFFVSIFSFFVLLCLVLLCSVFCCAGGFAIAQFKSSDFKEYDPKDIHQRRGRPQFIFKRWEDEYKMDIAQYESLLRTTGKQFPKKIREQLKKALENKKANDKKMEEERMSKLSEQLEVTLKETNNDPFLALRQLRKQVFVIDFNVDTKQDDVEKLSLQITLLCKVGDPKRDLVVLRIYSPGGPVVTYGLAASQLIRLRNAGFKTVACVDKIAASGGYMMCCVCEEICAAPFSIVGSIGVIARIPNLERVTKETLKVDMYQFTGGKYKRTVDIFGEVTEEGKEKLISEINVIHDEFKDHVKKYRGDKIQDIDVVATGESWLAINASQLGLVDRLVTSDEVLLELSKEYDVLLLVEFKISSTDQWMEIFSSKMNMVGKPFSKIMDMLKLVTNGDQSQNMHLMQTQNPQYSTSFE